MALQASTLVDMPFQDLDGCADLGSVEGRGQLDGLDGDGPRGKIRRELDQPALGEIISKKDIGTDKVALPTRVGSRQAGGLLETSGPLIGIRTHSPSIRKGQRLGSGLLASRMHLWVANSSGWRGIP